jgi:hypothetical protein
LEINPPKQRSKRKVQSQVGNLEKWNIKKLKKNSNFGVESSNGQHRLATIKDHPKTRRQLSNGGIQMAST